MKIKTKIKKIFTGLGLATLVAIPVLPLVACAQEEINKEENELWDILGNNNTLTDSDFANAIGITDQKGMLPSSLVTKAIADPEEIVFKLKTKIEAVKNLESKTKDLLNPDNISVESDDEKGQIKITLRIANHEREMTYEGYQNSLETEFILELFQNLEGLTNEELTQALGIIEKTNVFPEDETKITVLNLKNALISILRSQKIPEKNIEYLNDERLKIAIDPENATGVITITLIFGTESEHYHITGYKSNNNIDLLKNALLGISNQNFQAELSISENEWKQLPSEAIQGDFAPGQIAVKMKNNLSQIKSLDPEVINLLNPNTIFLVADDASGTVTINFTLFDNNLNFSITGFEKS